MANASYVQAQKHNDPQRYQASVEFVSHEADLAIITVDEPGFFSDLQALTIGDLPEPLQEVSVYGYPIGGKTLSITKGILSRVEQQVYAHAGAYLLAGQIDAAINPGNSGGALVNLNGKLIGINTAIATGGYERSNRGVGFAIPANMVNKVMNDLINKGYVVRGWLGVAIQEIDDSYAKALDLETRDGALISNVASSSPADNAGLITGDVILEFNDISINNSSHLKNVVSAAEPGKRYKVDICLLYTSPSPRDS